MSCIFTRALIILCRVVLTTSVEWGALVTKLNVPKDWKGSLSLSLSHTHRARSDAHLLNHTLRHGLWETIE
jgi:hypothetical protein